jgi:hypothetical protein
MFIKKTIILLVLFSINCLVYSNNNTIFASWIERTCKPFDKGKLTAFPRFNIVSRNLNMSAMLRFEDLPEVNSERWLLPENFEDEVWKDIPNYEGYYQVSNYGRIKSLKREVQTERNYLLQIPKEMILKARCDSGYSRYEFCKDGVHKKTSAHRMEALAFIQNTEDKPFIDHIDGNKMNNCLYNLRWCTASENMRNEITVQKLSEASKGRIMSEETKRKISEQKVGKKMCGENPNAKRVLQFDKNGNLLKEWSCAAEAARELGFNFRNISACCNGKKHTHRGYIWRFSSNDI